MLKNAPMFKRIDPKMKVWVQIHLLCFAAEWLRMSFQ